jgi:hypothetical protein
MPTGSARLGILVKVALGDGSKTPEETANQLGQLAVQNDTEAAEARKTKQELLIIDQKLEGQMRATIVKYQADIVQIQADIKTAEQSAAGITQSFEFAQYNLKAAVINAIKEEMDATAKVTAIKDELAVVNSKVMTAGDKVRAAEGIQNRLVLAQYELDRKVAMTEQKQKMLVASEEAQAIALTANAASVKAAQDVLANRNIVLDAKIEEQIAKSKQIEVDLKTAKDKGMNWWYVINGLMHLADRLMDKTNSDFAHFFGLTVSIITNAVTSMHALSVGLAASGPVGMIQAGIIVTSSTIATATLIQGESQRMQLEANKDNIGDTMFL